MARQYERCAEGGGAYEAGALRRVGERRVCSLCAWLEVARARPGRSRPDPETGEKPSAPAR